MNQTANTTAGPIGLTGATGGTGGQVLFFHHDPVEEPEGYEGLFPIPAGTTEADEMVVVQTGTGQVLVDPYITLAGYPGLTTLPAGLWRFRTFHYVDSNPGDTNAVFKVYNRSGETETLLFTAISGDVNALEPSEYLTSFVQTEDYTVLLTDRLVIKVYGQSDHSANVEFHFVYEGTNHTSHVQTPLETSSSLYIRHDGSVNFTGSQSMGGYNLTNLLDPVSPQDAATKIYVDTVNATAITDHGDLTGLDGNDHTQYPVYTTWATWTPTKAWTGGTPTVTKTTSRWTQIGTTVFIRFVVVCSDGDDATGLTVTLPVNPPTTSTYPNLYSYQRVNAVLSAGNPRATIYDDGTNKLVFEGLSMMTTGQSTDIHVSGFYEVAT